MQLTVCVVYVYVISIVVTTAENISGDLSCERKTQK